MKKKKPAREPFFLPPCSMEDAREMIKRAKVLAQQKYMCLSCGLPCVGGLKFADGAVVHVKCQLQKGLS